MARLALRPRGGRGDRPRRARGMRPGSRGATLHRALRGIGVCIRAGVLAFEPVRQRSAFRRMRRVRAAATVTAALVEQGCVDHFGPRARGDERCSVHAQVFVPRAGGGDASRAQREPGPRADSIIILALGMLRYKYVHIYEKWSWIPTTTITFFVVLGRVAKHLVNVPMRTGGGHDGEIGMMMVMDAEAARRRAYDECGAEARVVETEMDAGLIFLLVLMQWLGAAIMCVAGRRAPSNDAWAAAYAVDRARRATGRGARPHRGELWQVLHGAAGAQRGLDEPLNQRHWWLTKVPRLVWPIVITAIYIPIPIADANSFSSLEDLMNALGYWLSIFVVVILLEHFVFHKGDWAPAGQDARRYRGTSGVFVGRARDGDEIWYIGKIGALVGMGRSANPFGGDIGFELSGVFVGIVYLPAHYLELKYIGR
ncbi:hypothetical protein B0H13DRAFT_1889764 [Mycena leptocephala]|nr:hypothetical protein B0H13DRAFT_1889764 [Mycena leptocephala]